MKKEYKSPSTHWIWLGLGKDCAITTRGVETSTPRTTRVNVWNDDEESSDGNEVWGQTW